MIMNNAQMLESVIVLSQIDEKGMLGYAVAKNRKKLIAEIEVYSAKRDELLREYGENIGDGKYRLIPDNATLFYRALQPYSDLTTDVAVMQVSPEVFYGGNLTSNQMFTLDWMVKE